jgi:hypothetical protein
VPIEILDSLCSPPAFHHGALVVVLSRALGLALPHADALARLIGIANRLYSLCLFLPTSGRGAASAPTLAAGGSRPDGCRRSIVAVVVVQPLRHWSSSTKQKRLMKPIQGLFLLLRVKCNQNETSCFVQLLHFIVLVGPDQQNNENKATTTTNREVNNDLIMW